MAKILNLLLLDANVVIHLFEIGLWDSVIERCEVHVGRIVVNEEALYYEDTFGTKHSIDLTHDEQSGAINVFDVDLKVVKEFRDGFDPEYMEQMHDGETESLVYLVNNEGFTLCSADPVVFRVLGNIDCGDQGMSLEEVLGKIRIPRSVPHQFSKRYRLRWTEQGAQEKKSGIGKK